MKNITKTLGALLVTSLFATAALTALASAADEEIDLRGRFSEALQNGDTETVQEMYNQCVQNHEQNGMGPHGQHEQPEDFEEMMSAIESGDYDAWYTLMSSHDDPRSENLLETITEENFDTFIEMHEARKSQDHETAEELMDELGLEGPRGQMHGTRGVPETEE